MDENYLISLMVAFFFGLAFFKKDTKISFDTQEVSRIPSRNASGHTGVSHYLQKKQDLRQEMNPTGVAKYLVLKEADLPVSSVSKYIARQSVLANIVAEENKSGVEKYLSNRS